MRVRQLGDPILRRACESVDLEKISGLMVQNAIDRMKSVLNGIKSISDDNGNAISAPQIGLSQRLILLRIDQQFKPMINPTFTPLSDKTFEFNEECFSFYQLRAKVTRFYAVKVTYYDDKAQPASQILIGENAGLVQHEIDHLDGVFFLDRVKDKSQLASVDFIYNDSPVKLAQIKKMMAYMVG